MPLLNSAFLRGIYKFVPLPSKYIKAKTKRRRPAPERMQSLKDRGKLSAPEKQLLARYLDADLRTKTGDRFKKFVNLKKDNNKPV